MAWRILIRLDEDTHRVALVPGEHEVGSRSDCVVSIPHPTVSRRHAVFFVTDTSVRLVDAGSRNGIRIDGARTDAVDMAPGQVVHLGGVPITLEMVPDMDLEAAVLLGDAARVRPDSGGLTQHSTHSAGTAEEFAIRHLPQLLRELANGASVDTMVRQVGAALFASLPCFEATFERGGGIIFTAQREGAPEANTEAVASVAAEDGAWTIVFPAPHMARAYRPILELAAQVITMATPNRQTTASVSPPDTSPTSGAGHGRTCGQDDLRRRGASRPRRRRGHDPRRERHWQGGPFPLPSPRLEPSGRGPFSASTAPPCRASCSSPSCSASKRV